MVRAKDAWPSSVSNHLRFVLAKENCDTSAAIASLSKAFRCSADNIKYAGTKDKRAVTFQYVTIYRRKPSDVIALNRFVAAIVVLLHSSLHVMPFTFICTYAHTSTFT